MDKTARKSKTMPILIGLGLFLVIAIWLGIGTEPGLKAFTIPSAGMAPTLIHMTGSLPAKTPIEGMLPERGDVVVFKSEGAYRVQRVVACLVTRSLSKGRSSFRERRKMALSP